MTLKTSIPEVVQHKDVLLPCISSTLKISSHVVLVAAIKQPTIEIRH